MCLLVQQPADTNFSDRFLTGVYSRNSDGIGIMWAEDGVLHYYKSLPTSAAEFIKVYREKAEGKECCWHARMKTHGNIDLTNCHPYPLLGFDEEVKDTATPMLLMHNGVLSTGNSKDTTKSDTWHYIRDYLRPLLLKYPDMLHDEAFQKIVAAHIGSSNKFAVMDATGKAVILNRQAGIEYEGAWLSNTYAWDYSGLHPNAPKYTPKPNSFGSYYSSWKNRSVFEDDDASDTTVIVPPTSVVKPLNRREKKALVRELNNVGRVPTPLKDVIADYNKMLSEEFPEAAERITTFELASMFYQIGRWDAEDFISMFFSGDITEDVFVDGVKFPLTAQRSIYFDGLDDNKLQVGLL